MAELIATMSNEIKRYIYHQGHCRIRTLQALPNNIEFQRDGEENLEEYGSNTSMVHNIEYLKYKGFLHGLTCVFYWMV